MTEEVSQELSELSKTDANSHYATLPLRDVVVFPQMVLPLFVGRQRSVAALEYAMKHEKQVFLVTQKEAAHEEPQREDLYPIGTLATVLQMLKLRDGTVKVLVEGDRRGEVKDIIQQDPCIMADIGFFESAGVPESEEPALVGALLNQFEQYVKINKKIPAEILSSLGSISDIERLTDTIASHLPIKVELKQKILETHDTKDRVEQLMKNISQEIDILKVDRRINERVKDEMEKKQREYYLRIQQEAIEKELGEIDETGGELEELEKKIKESGMPEEAMEKSLQELKKLKNMPMMSAESTVSRNYLDWMVKVPWKERAKVNDSLKEAEKILAQDHYGLKEVKEIIVEYLAVQLRVKELKGKVLCLVGPPGVGKTSLGESIARATGRQFIRMSLGGVRDEAEIRGHRRTYIGALPGKVLQMMAKSGTRNPLFMLDEVDKMAMDFRGDPASALLEVLDPEQNHAFNDHYLEVDYDLSEVMFICTANSLNIPAPLLDRMEVVRIPGYTEDEKVHISTLHLLPKQFRMNGVEDNEITVSESVVREIVRYYTRESGVRNLEREMGKICRKVVKENMERDKHKKTTITKRNLEKYLGVKKFRFGVADENDRVGQVTGLAWTRVGGELLTIESVAVPGKGKVISTGQLGDVMQESFKAAMTVVRSRSQILGIKPSFYHTVDIHVHVPEGATPKDGPSAGSAMCTALVSTLTNIPVRKDVAMTGEITLRGEILPIGGLKEKLLAAHRGGIKTVLIPHENQRELKEIPANITKNLDVRPVRWIDEVWAIALSHMPKPLTDAEMAEEDSPKGAETKRKKKGASGEGRAH